MADPSTASCVNCRATITEAETVRSTNCEHLFCQECGESDSYNRCHKCKKYIVSNANDAQSSEKQTTMANTIANAAPPPLDPTPPKFTHHTPSQPSLPQPPQTLQHFSYMCPGLHGPGSHTNVVRMSFEHLFNPSSSTRVIIPLFQRPYCWNTSTTVPTWWRDTAKGAAHSCGKLVFKWYDDAWWCLDGQQRVTTTMLLIASARDALLRLQLSAPSLPNISSALEKLEAVLFVDIRAAHEFASSRTPIAEGQRLTFGRMVPSFCDRRHFFELIIGGLVSNGTDEGLSETTRRSIQYDTKHYFDTQFQQMINSNKPSIALDSIVARAKDAINVQLMFIEPLSEINVAQVYQYLQESSLLSMGSLLFNPSPGMQMHACDLTRNFCLSPWTGESLAEQERLHATLWLAPIEVPCGSSPSRIDAVLKVLVDKNIPDGITSETEKKLIGITQLPGFSQHDLSGLLLYARVLTLWEHFEEKVRGSISDVTERQKSVAIQIMQLMGAICAEV